LNEEEKVSEAVCQLCCSINEEFVSVVIVTSSTVADTYINKLYELFERLPDGSIRILTRTKGPVDDSKTIPRIPCIQNIYFSCFDRFWDVYYQCTEMFSSGTEEVQRFRHVYYASEIIPGFLFLGDYTNGEASQLESLGITHVVDASGDRASEKSAHELGLSYMPVDVEDVENADILSFFSETNKFIRSAHLPDHQCSGGDDGHQQGVLTCNYRVLVHCRAGMSRSASIVIAYLLYSSIAKNLKHALRIVIKQRPIICPNNGFQRQLLRYERNVLSKSPSPSFRDEKAMRNWITLERAGRNRDSI
jgi:hypothetical protein